jgi:hypothetical protein
MTVGELVSETTLNWEQADRVAIKTGGGDADSWQAGHVNDVAPLADGTLLLATDTGGVWQVRRATRAVSGFTRPLSDDWDNPNLMCLATLGTDFALVGCQGLTGTSDRLYETRDSLLADAVVPPAWRAVNAPTGVGMVYRIVIASTLERLRVVLATDVGLYWSEITAQGLPYVWNQVSATACSGLALGPGRSVVASTLSAGQILRFTWSGPANAAVLTGQPVRLPLAWTRRAPRLGRSSLAACGDDPRHMYCVAAFNDPNKGFDTFLRALASSGDGGATWDWLDAKAGGHTLYSLDMSGDQGGYDNCIAVSPTDPRTVVVGWVSLFVSTDGGKDFKRFQGGSKLHADLHALVFDPAHPKQLYIGSDGGVVRTDNLAGKFVASYNKELLNLQFASVPERVFYGSTSASPSAPGMVAGGLQDNGVVYAVPRATPWRSVQGGDGALAMFIAPGQLVSSNQEGPAGISRSQSALTLSDPSTIPIKRSGNRRDTNGLPDPVAERVQDGVPELIKSGQRMYAVGGNGQPPQTLYGLFANPDGGNAAWRKLVDLPGSPAAHIWSVASQTGATVFVGTATNTDKKGNVTAAAVYRVDAGQSPASALPPVPTFSGGASDPNGIVSRIVLPTGQQPTVAYNAYPQGVVLTATGSGASTSWSVATGLPGSQVFGLAVDPLGNVYAATDDQVFISRDGAQSFTSVSDGLPRRPHSSHLFTSQHHTGVTLYMSTFGRSVWTARWITRLGEESGIAFGRLVGARNGGGLYLATPQGLQAVTSAAPSAAQLRPTFRALVNLVPQLTVQLKTVEDAIPLTTTGRAFRMRLHETVGAVELAIAGLVYLADDVPLHAGNLDTGPQLERATTLLTDSAGTLHDLAQNQPSWDRGLPGAAGGDCVALRDLAIEVTGSITSLSELEGAFVNSL